VILVAATEGGGGSSPSDRCYCKLPKSQPPGSACRRSALSSGVLDLPEATAPMQSFSSHGNPTRSSPVLSRADGFMEVDNAKNSADMQKQVLYGSKPDEFDAGTANVPKAEEDIDKISFSFVSWCMSLTRKVMQCRTAFGHFLSQTLHLPRDGPTAPPTALFPLPVPNEWPLSAGPNRSRSTVSKHEAVSRALHVVVMALNNVYWSRATPSLDLLRRQPNQIQADALSELRLLIESCDRCKRIEVAASGRKNLQLMARLKDLALAAEALGLSCSPYSEVRTDVQVGINNEGFPQLQPFSNLKPERLKITGRGQWDASSFIEPELYMAFMEPQVIELESPVYDRGRPNFLADEPSTVFELFRRWDDLGLLVLHPRSHITTGDAARAKVFNAFKSLQHDRQIGDRRERNSWEGRIPGPSAALPVSSLLSRLVIPEGCGIKLCVADRSDYYHQLAVSFERSRTNAVWPPMPLEKFVEFKAYKAYVARAASSRRPIDRTVHGDHLHGHRPSEWPTAGDTEVCGAFGAILQGDHLGVEFGISAHVGLLQSAGLLPDEGRLVTDALVRPHDVYQGLCIGDFFAIAPVPAADLGRTDAPRSPAFEVFQKAKRCYASAGLQGSDAKDVIESTCGTAVGAELNSSKKLVDKGLLPVAAPAEKRLALSWISLQAARLSCTSDALHPSLVGGLVSTLCFRRCGMALLGEVFKVIPPAELKPEKPKLRPLSRKAADELVLCAVLLPLMSSNIKALFHPWVYASDASMHRGAYCEARICRDFAHPLWLSGDFKGGHAVLDSWQRRVFEDAGVGEEEDWLELQEEGPDDPLTWKPKPARPLAQRFDFLEVCGGSGVISDEVAKYGLVVGPIIDLSYSSQYDLVNLRVVEWLLFMIQNRRVRSLALEPPCTTFSPAAHPACRSYNMPRGWNQKAPKVWLGNRLAFACMTLLLAAAYACVIALLETPRRSKMAWLKEWQFLLSLWNVEENYTASCSYGSPFQKEFRFLTCNMRASSICKPCTRDHKHTVIQGQLTKGSSVYCPGLAKALARLFAVHLDAERLFAERSELRATGLESPFVNELAKRHEWSVGSSWKWTGSSHINVLELASAVQSTKAAARRGGGRTCLLLDSNVAVRALAKGRSSSKALSPLLRKVMALCMAFGIMLSILFVPARLNVADDPTRSKELRARFEGPSFLDSLDCEGLFKLAEMPPLRRWISNWTSLFLGLCLRHNLRPGTLSIPSPRRRSSLPPVDFYQFLLDFDSTLGFPGEGPSLSIRRLVVLWIWGVFICSHGMVPRNKDDERRAFSRTSKPLQTGRPVQEVTRSNRQRLLEMFGQWLDAQGLDLSKLLRTAYTEPEAVVTKLVEYGQALYAAGRPYSHYSETVNAVSAAKPTIRRMLTGAWDFAFAWLREEPGEHHLACPFQVLLALLSLAILWGWPLVAGVISLSWGAVCRIGEVLQAMRKDLVLPSDVGDTMQAVFLRVQEPKTRFRAARHQMTRLEYSDLVLLISSAFRDVKPLQRLWPYSAQNL